ncbi:hypothetical protein BGZ63DRAFT_47814 [Mariannaea sp. PMI_226]|nr:hypothetical protein BGZ63DRAFT_47814 [Mariannaea sp. PMI_226]
MHASHVLYFVWTRWIVIFFRVSGQPPVAINGQTCAHHNKTVSLVQSYAACWLQLVAKHLLAATTRMHHHQPIASQTHSPSPSPINPRPKSLPEEKKKRPAPWPSNRAPSSAALNTSLQGRATQNRHVPSYSFACESRVPTRRDLVSNSMGLLAAILPLEPV